MKLLSRANHFVSSVSKFITESRWRHLFTAGLVLMSILIIAGILMGNWETLVAFDWQITPIWLLIGLLLLLVNFALNAWVWHLLSDRLVDSHNARFNIKVWCYANLLRRIPGTVWFVAGRAMQYEKIGVSKLRVSILSGIELALILGAGLLTGLVALPILILTPAFQETLKGSWLLIPIFVLVGLLLHPRVLGKIWGRLGQSDLQEQPTWRDISLWVGLFVLAWVTGGFTLFSTINFVHSLPISEFIPILGIWVVANTVSVAGALTIGGFGLREISLTVLLSQIVPAPVALVISLLMRVIWLAAELLGALVSLLL